MGEGVPGAAAAAAVRAQRYLLEQADGEFQEACHTMRFPRAAGFGGEVETHVADVFPRAVLAGVLLDAAEIGDDGTFRARVVEIARREADHVAARRLRDRAGGWSYFPGLAELPPDLDSLSAVLLLFARAAPDHLPLTDAPVDLALGQAGEDGAIPTWLVSPTTIRSTAAGWRRASAAFGATAPTWTCSRTSTSR